MKKFNSIQGAQLAIKANLEIKANKLPKAHFQDKKEDKFLLNAF